MTKKNYFLSADVSGVSLFLFWTAFSNLSSVYFQSKLKAVQDKNSSA
jgi:hypothetical protein